jgi:hypothetical protein
MREASEMDERGVCEGIITVVERWSEESSCGQIPGLGRRKASADCSGQSASDAFIDL